VRQAASLTRRGRRLGPALARSRVGSNDLGRLPAPRTLDGRGRRRRDGGRAVLKARVHRSSYLKNSREFTCRVFSEICQDRFKIAPKIAPLVYIQVPLLPP
jgi:hypothetical protein